MSNESLNNISKELNNLKSKIKESIHGTTPFETLFKSLFKELIKFFLEGEFSRVSEKDIKNHIGNNLKALTSEDFKPPIDHKNNQEDDERTMQREKELEKCVNTVQISFESALYFNSLSLGKQNISDVIKKIHKEISNKIRVNNLRTVLNEVLRLTYYDFEFAKDEYPERLVKNLCEIINLFQKKETGMEGFQQLILEKATFLLSKALFCYDENERSELFVMFEGEKKICEKLLESVKVSERSKDLISLINLYEKEKLDEQEVKKLRSLKQKFSGNKLLQAYIDVKIYKDSKNLDFSQPDLVLNSLNKIQKLNDNLEEETGDDVSIFDEVSIKVNKTFILNNLISLADELLVHFNKQKGLSFSNKSNEIDCVYELVKKAMNQIEEIENSPKNYFTYYKYSKFLCNYYIYQAQNNNIAGNKQSLPEVLEIEKHAKIASDLLYKLEKFQRYRLSYEGSFIHIGKEKVFIYSSINLLFNYFGQRSLIEVQNIKANTIEVHRKMQDITQKSKEDVKKDMEKMKEDTKSQTQKEVNRMTQNVVGLLGIFSAVITFSFGSIQLFRHLTDFSQAFILMSLFAFSTIITFLCVMHIVYQKKDWKSLICTIVIILTATLVFALVIAGAYHYFRDISLLP